MHSSTSPLLDSSGNLHGRMLKPPSQDIDQHRQQGEGYGREFHQGQHQGQHQGLIGEHQSIFGDLSSFFKNHNSVCGKMQLLL